MTLLACTISDMQLALAEAKHFDHHMCASVRVCVQ